MRTPPSTGDKARIFSQVISEFLIIDLIDYLSQLMESGNDKKYVFAHFMVGNTYPYTLQDWVHNIVLASRYHIDGFALNVGKEDWQKSRVDDCFEAALRTRLNFRLFISFDMMSISGDSPRDIETLCSYVQAFADHPNTFQIDGKVVVSTFAGQGSSFGQQTMDAAWTNVKMALERIAPIYFVPAFFINPSRYQQLHSLDGAFNWNGSWPVHLTKDASSSEKARLCTSDQEYIQNLGGRTFMAAVSPWFFTHYGAESWNKNWIYYCDRWHLVRRWEQIMQMRDRVDIVQVISWNDYGESHYIGPVEGAQPNSEAWVNGFPHEPWLHLNSYYAQAFREGRYSPIVQDKIYMWARPHTKQAYAPDTVPKPSGWELTDDAFWVVIFSTAPATVILSSGSVYTEFSLQGGVKCLSSRLTVEAGMRARLVRDDIVVADCNPVDFRFTNNPSVYNFNAFVAMSP